MYARHEFNRLSGTRMEAGLLGELKTCRSILFHSAPDSLSGVRGLYCQIRGLPKKAALDFCCEGRSVLLCTEGAFRVSVDRYNAAWTGHLELKISIVRYRIESSKCGSSKQCVIATVKGDDI